MYSFLYTILIMGVFMGIVAFFIEKNKFQVLGLASYLLIIVPILFLLLFYLKGKQIFEYDSDGEAIHFRNRSVFVLFTNSASDEFPKYKLVKYEIIKFLFIKRLYITISSKNKGSTILKYEISYLTRKEVNDLKLSLNKVVKNNQQNILKNS